MKQDNSGKIVIHEKKSFISIVSMNLQFCRFIISKTCFFYTNSKSKVQNRNDGKAKTEGCLTFCILAPLVFTPVLVIIPALEYLGKRCESVVCNTCKNCD